MDEQKQKTNKNESGATKKLSLRIVAVCLVAILSSVVVLTQVAKGNTELKGNSVNSLSTTSSSSDTTLDFSGLAADTSTTTPLASLEKTPTVEPYILFEGYVYEFQEPSADAPTPRSGQPVDYRGNPVYTASLILSENDIPIAETSTNHFGYFRFGFPAIKGAVYSVLVKKNPFTSIKASLLAEEKELLGVFIMHEGDSSAEEDQSDNIKKLADSTSGPPPTPDYRRIDTLAPVSLNVDYSSFGQYLDFLLTWLYSIAATIGIIAIMSAGYGYITAAGNPSLLNQSKKRLFNTGIALALIFTSWALTALIGGFSVLEWGL